MDWINKQLGRLTKAEGNQSVALGAFLGFLVALGIAAFHSVSAGWMLVLALAGTLPGAVVMTAFFCLLAGASRRQTH